MNEASSTVRLQGTLEDLEILHRELSALTRRRALDDSTAQALRLALDELITNVIEHGLDKSRPAFLSVQIATAEASITITIEDNGKPFDPTASGSIDTSETIEQRGIGGLGLHLVRQSVDEIEYRRENEHNVLVIRKALPGLAATSRDTK